MGCFGARILLPSQKLESGVEGAWGIADVAVIVPWPFTTLWQKVEYIMFAGLTTLIGTALWLFALIYLDLWEVTMFSSMDKQVSKQEEALLFCLLLWSDKAVQSESYESEEE